MLLYNQSGHINNELKERGDKNTDKDTNKELVLEEPVHPMMHWNLQEGITAKEDEYHILASFAIPTNNEQTEKALISELAQLQKKEGMLPLSIDDGVSGLDKDYIYLPIGKSSAACWRFTQTLSNIIKPTPDEVGLAKAVLKRIDRDNSACFLDIVTKNGYSTQRTPKVSANYWVAMNTDANLQKQQSRVVSAYLTTHFG